MLHKKKLDPPRPALNRVTLTFGLTVALQNYADALWGRNADGGSNTGTTEEVAMLKQMGSLVLGLGLAAGFLACGDDEPTTANNNSTQSNNNAQDNTNQNTNPYAACTQTIETKSAANSGALGDWPLQDASEMLATSGNQASEADYAGRYRDDLANHPGCAPRTEYVANGSEPFVSDNEATVPAGSPASINGYPCAAKVYDQPNEDTSKPIVILVHGNSSGVTSFEEYGKADLAGTTITNVAGFEIVVDTSEQKQLATRLVEEGYAVIGFDARVDLVNTLVDYNDDATAGNPFRNIDHGWAVPMLQSLIKAVITENDGRKVSLIGHSLGVTVIRDSLRRLYLESKAGTTGAVNPFEHLQDVILLSGANHGVSTGATFCQAWTHMRGTVACQMGDLTAYQPTFFTRPNNGPDDLFSTPCADANYAFGDQDACGGNAVQYTTVTMKDLPGGLLQDEFVSEQSSRLDMPGCVDNALIELSDFDGSGYFFTGAPGFLANHFGSARSAAGIQLIVDKLGD